MAAELQILSYLIHTFFFLQYPQCNWTADSQVAESGVWDADEEYETEVW